MRQPTTSADQLRTNLNAAFKAWKEASPRQHTQAEFARRCAATAGRPCSAQTVHSWLQTGRVDKLWLPVLESLLGTALGFGTPPSVSVALDTLIAAAREASPAVRRAAAQIARLLIEEPESSEIAVLTRAFMTLFPESPSKPTNPRQPYFTPFPLKPL